MEAKTQKVLIGGLVTLVVAALGFGTYHLVKKKSNKTSSSKKKSKEEKKLIGKQVNFGSLGYVNVRNTPKVDNENWGAFDFSHNLIKQAKTNPVGSVLERVKGEDGYFWYKISMDQGKEGYVREDAVIIED